MNLERALETQRLRLLRLLAGLLAAVAFLSVAPIAPAWSRWVCARVWSVLMRTEAAAQSLVQAQVFVEAKRRGITSDQMSRLVHPALGDPAVLFDADDVPPLAVLRQRMKALQCLLNNLTRRGEALLRRLTRAVAEKCDIVSAWFDAGEVSTRVGANQWRAPGLWHPPERMLHLIRL